MHWVYVSKLQLLYSLDEHQGYCPNLWAAAGAASLVTANIVASISKMHFIGDTIIEEPSSATMPLQHSSKALSYGKCLALDYSASNTR
jgi:hypothetical protein